MATYQDRPTVSVAFYVYNGVLGPSEMVAYGILEFEISNQAVEVQRIYPTVVNLFQKIGGVAQIFIFVFVYLMIYNNEVIIELYLLNHGVLMLPQDSKTETKKLNQVADISMKKSGSNAEAYTYWEILNFKLFSCCSKKSAKYP